MRMMTGPLLIVNASQIDPVNNDADYEQLFQQIERHDGRATLLQPGGGSTRLSPPRKTMYTQLEQRGMPEPPVNVATLRKMKARRRTRSHA